MRISRLRQNGAYKMATCKLCGHERKLIKAHIIPESFLALPTSDEGSAKILSSIKSVYPKTTRTGIYDDSILCQRCDGELGIFDQHAAEALIKPTETEELSFIRVIGRSMRTLILTSYKNSCYPWCGVHLSQITTFSVVST
jgi:hypothetical protein